MGKESRSLVRKGIDVNFTTKISKPHECIRSDSKKWIGESSGVLEPCGGGEKKGMKYEHDKGTDDKKMLKIKFV